MKRNENQDLNFDLMRLSEIAPKVVSLNEKMKNWVILTDQLDKIGIMIENETRDEICNGDQPQIDRLFQRIERYMKIIAGAAFLNFDNVPDDLFDMDTLIQELPDYNI